MRILLLLATLPLAGCGDDPALFDPGEVLLTEATAGTLLLATRDASERVAPALAAELSAPRLGLVQRHLAGLESALETRRAGAVRAAAGSLERTLFMGQAGDGGSVPSAEADLGALHILAALVDDAVAHASGATP